MTQTIIDFPVQDKDARHLELLTLATGLLCQALDLKQHDSFFDQEKALASDIVALGRLVTQRAAGIPVGSGATEATCKSVAAVRLKRSGCRWKVAGAHACMTLRALAISDGRWEPVFAHFARSYVRQVEPFEHGNEGSQTLIREAA